MIPIVIVCYNNYKYVDNTINQILKYNNNYINDIILLNNCSTCIDTLEYIKNVKCKIIHNTENYGPRISPINNQEIYNSLPDKFILTDPDLKFNDNLPNNFIDILLNLSDKYNCHKVGFALDISDFDKMFQNTYYENMNIYDWEKQFWQNKIDDNNYELYYAPIDTTFSVINKNFSFYGTNIRVAGDFTAKHLPWYVSNNMYNLYELYSSTSCYTTVTFIKSYINDKYLKINKNNLLFLIENTENNNNISFWRDIYTNWEDETFQVFDKYLNKDKIFLDIGGWIGTTTMYGSRKSKFVYTIEADKKSFDDMHNNCKINCISNYELINKAIYNIDNYEVKFGKNKFISNSKMNDSTSQIYDNTEISDEFYSISTITIDSIFKKYNINPNDISLIKVDIEGGEEYILSDLFDIHKINNTPMYISFHYTWWKDKNLERFDFLTETQKNNIINKPFISILFT